MKIIIYTLLAFLFIGCSKDVPGESGIELKNHLTFEGSVTPEYEALNPYHGSQLYILRNGSCLKHGNSYVVLDTIFYHKKDVIGRNITDNKYLFPFGIDSDIINREFCIDQQNGKTFLYVDDNFKRKHSQEESIIAAENLILAINKTKLGNQVENENKNYKSWN